MKDWKLLHPQLKEKHCLDNLNNYNWIDCKVSNQLKSTHWIKDYYTKLQDQRMNNLRRKLDTDRSKELRQFTI